MRSPILLVCSMYLSLLSQPLMAVEWSAMHGLGNVEYFTLSRSLSNEKQQGYHIFVRVPDVSKNTPEALFPTLILLDGGTNFPLMASYYEYLHFMQDVPDMLVVGIGYDGGTWPEGNNRSHDFTLPAKNRSHWGGAPGFEQMLINELLPKLERDYSADPQRHILFGQSLGGQFGLYVSLYGKAPFYGVIASNPALHRNLNDFLRPVGRSNPLPKTYISFAEFDAERFRTPALLWREHWQGKAPKWHRLVADLPGHNHLSANPEALRNGILWLLKEP